MAKDEKIDWSDFQVTEGPKPGDKQDATIVKIQKTTWRQYLKGKGREDSISRFENSDGPQLMIVCKTADGREIETLFSMPEGNAVSANSNLGKYKGIYKKFPEVGDKVQMMADAKGFWNLFVGLK